MSFPLLCLINKTVVDISLSRLLTEGKISFKEWTSHRCLINGDDLLLKEPRRGKSFLRPEIVAVASAVGMKVNEEKTLVSPWKGEINSTLFIDGYKQEKTNAGALVMRPEVNDVLGFASSSTRTIQGFRRVVRKNRNILARQENKGLSCLHWTLQMVCRKDRAIRQALLSAPLAKRKPPANLFPVVEEPTGYDLTIDEEIACIDQRVAEVRSRAIELSKERKTFRTSAAPVKRSWRSLLKSEPASDKETILKVLADAWELKKKEQLVEEEGGMTSTFGLFDYASDQSRIDHMVDSIRAWRGQRRCEIPILLPVNCNGKFTEPGVEHFAFD